MAIVQLKSVFLVCCWSAVLMINHDLQYRVGIQLCAQHCFLTGSCTNIRLNDRDLHCKLMIEKIARRNISSLAKRHPSVWEHVPHLKCEENHRLIITKRRGPVCVSGQIDLSSTSISTLAPDNNTALVPANGEQGQIDLSSTSISTLAPDNNTALVPANGEQDQHSRTRSKTMTLKPVNPTTLVPVPEKPTAHQRKSCLGNNCTKKRSVCEPGRPCVCEVGFHYNPKNDNCLKVCREFGTRMVYYKGTGLDGHNDHIIRKLTLEQCTRKCVTFKKFLCKTFDYGRELEIGFMPKACYLSKAAYFEVPEKDRNPGKDWIMGVRDCKS